MSKAYDMLSDIRSRKQIEASKLFDEFNAVVNGDGKTDADIYRVGLKWAGASAASEALTEAITMLLEAGVI